jgi:valyl-tRNA synthetase
MPYLTEELWQRLPVSHSELLHKAYAGAEPSIMLAAYPKGDASLIDEAAEAEMRAVIDLISRVRNNRSEMNIKPGFTVLVRGEKQIMRAFEANAVQVERLTRGRMVVTDGVEVPKASARAVLSGGGEVAIPLEGQIDFAQERARRERQRIKLTDELTRLSAQLIRADFLDHAPSEKVAEIRNRHDEVSLQIETIDNQLEALS